MNINNTTLSLLLLHLHITSSTDPCTSQTLPCLHVPSCDDGSAAYGDFKITNVPTVEPALDQTTGEICWNQKGISVKEFAFDTHVFTPWMHCNDLVFQKSSVLEIFVAPVHHVSDNPIWYFELDTAPSGAMWSGLSNDSRGNSSTCVSADGCDKSGTLECTGINTFPHHLTTTALNKSKGWGIEMIIPWEMFAKEFQPTMLTQQPHSIWRMNFYRYSYPNGPNSKFSNYQLSGWSPTHDPSFHVPARFGVIVLDPAHDCENCSRTTESIERQIGKEENEM